MSSNPSSDDIGPREHSMPENDESLVVPASASYNVDYIMQIELETQNGTDIVLCNHKLRAKYRLNYMEMYLERQYAETSEHFNQSKEDYWLFAVHLHDAEMEIAIGGETPVLVNSKPTWQAISSEEGRDITVQSPDTVNGPEHFDLSYISDGIWPGQTPQI